MGTSVLGINLDVDLDRELKDNFGYIFDLATGGQNGSAKMQILGTLSQPRKVLR